MRKFICCAFALLSVNSFAATKDISFSFFDSPVKQGERFQAAFTQGEKISAINLDGRKIDLQGDWIVMSSWFDTNEIVMMGGGSNKVITNGILLLGRPTAGDLDDTLYLNIRLQKPVSNEWKNDISDDCISSSNTICSDVKSAEDKKQSCLGLNRSTYEDKKDNISRTEKAYRQYSTAYGLKATPYGSEMYSIDITETRGSAHVYATRYLRANAGKLDSLKDFAISLRGSIKKDFYGE